MLLPSILHLHLPQSTSIIILAYSVLPPVTPPSLTLSRFLLLLLTPPTKIHPSFYFTPPPSLHILHLPFLLHYSTSNSFLLHYSTSNSFTQFPQSIPSALHSFEIFLKRFHLLIHFLVPNPTLPSPSLPFLLLLLSSYPPFFPSLHLS